MGVDPDERLIEEVDNDIFNELEESDDENVDENTNEVCNNFMSDDEDATRGESIRDTLVFEMWRDYYRATGAGAETAKEKRKRWDNGSRYNYETVEGIDLLLSQNEVTLESFDRMDDYINTMVSPSTTSQVSTQSAQLKRKKKKKKATHVEYNVDDMIKAIYTLAEAIKEGNSMFEKS
ncbi:hypothetical protein Dsin_023194 [Dipteronia sinensis]|uniref:Uncharacterized protein n=1 Tax=Dipteronia sinensis TaxID=43782 RepID=A0AAE0E0T4_9ROSI|nr:hypothetical protein Dsin_023194 [Dipteronia sinensis]